MRSGLPKLRDGVESLTLDLTNLPPVDAAASTGRWVSEVRDYEGYGQFLIIRFPCKVLHLVANFRPLEDATLKVMIRVHFLNALENKAYAFIEALDSTKYINGIVDQLWTEKFRYQIDMWVNLEMQ
ncbi:MAG: hypothetical protein JW883_00345 [Deltaproteobacteria bacterium]|nr:hypothetical protein [Deltaproteobacteria bacterium]